MSDGDPLHEHGPQQGCKWTACGNPEAPSKCPFVRDVKPEPSAPKSAECQHEWRQLVGAGVPGWKPVFVFYCQFCLTTTTVDHITTTRQNMV